MPATTRCSSAAWRRPGSSRTISSSAWRWATGWGRTSTAWLLPGSCDMTSNDVSEAAKAVVRRNTEEVQSKGNFELFEELFADDFLDHTPQPGRTPDKAGARELYHVLREAFSDFHAEIHWQAADGDLVTTYKTYHGTHQGLFFGIAHTGREIHFETVDAMRVRNGQIVEHWGVANLLSLLQQLGGVSRTLHSAPGVPDDDGGATAAGLVGRVEVSGELQASAGKCDVRLHGVALQSLVVGDHVFPISGEKAAVDGDVRAGDVGRVVGEQECDDRRDLLGPSEALGRDRCGDGFDLAGSALLIGHRG